MKKALIVVIEAILAVSLSGCGTVCNLAGGFFHPDREPRIYGGVLRDVEFFDEVIREPKQQPSDPRAGLVLLLFVAVEPPLSFIADTVTLPITIYLQDRRVAASKSDTGNLVNSSKLATDAISLGKPIPLAQIAEGQDSEGERRNQAP